MENGEQISAPLVLLPYCSLPDTTNPDMMIQHVRGPDQQTEFDATTDDSDTELD